MYGLVWYVDSRMCPLSLMELVALITTQMREDEALAFLTTMEPKLGVNKEARALCALTRAHVQLIRKKDIASAKVCDSDVFCVGIVLVERCSSFSFKNICFVFW